MKRLHKDYRIGLLGILMAALFFVGCEEEPIAVEQESNVKLLETGEATYITPIGARLSGKIRANEDISCGIIYGTQSSLSNQEGKKAPLYTSEDFSVDLVTLHPNTTYYYRAYATENGEYQYGEVRSFTTPSLMEAGQAVDLGLSIRWASCDIGATIPEETGYRYAWGEANANTSGWWEAYKWCKGDEYSMTKYCTDSQYGHVDGRTKLELFDDAAYVLWGKGWRMPTDSECQELIDNCTWELVDLSSIGAGDYRYYIVTGPNGNYILLPAKDHWTSETSGNDYAHMLDIQNDWNRWVGGHYRCERKSIRPVCYGSWIESAENNGSNDNNEGTEDEVPTDATYTVNGVSFKMIGVEGGTFMMGSTESDVYGNGKPAHQVTLSSYSIGETEVTQELWQAVMGGNPSYNTGDLQCPVEQASRNEFLAFILKLNELTGENFRFPTEAEWEFAARGGNASQGYKYSGSNTIEDVAWYADNSSDETHPVKTKLPNELGIYDMSGNVGEYCADWYEDYSSSAQTNPTGPSSGYERVSRGGSWVSGEIGCRVAYRFNTDPNNRYIDVGLRLAR